MLQTSNQKTGRALNTFVLACHPFFPQSPVLINQCHQAKLRRVSFKILDINLHDMALWEAANDLTEVVFQSAYHHVIEVAL